MRKLKRIKSSDLGSCILSKNNQNFSMPFEIIEAATKGNLVIFAGAGISTECMPVFPFSLYEDILGEIEDEPCIDNLTFPELMSKFCRQPNGRKKLLEKILLRIDYVNSFPELYRWATRFHKELSTIHCIKEIITTNWDDFFEKECGAIPIVTPDDFAFRDINRRKVYKIHGSINNLSTIVATNEDYQACYKRLKASVIGSNLKMLLATKTVVFVGYSFGDFDFNKIYSFLKKEMNDIIPHGYVVSIDKDSAPKYEKLGLTPIITDGTYFLSILKKHLVERDYMIEYDSFTAITTGIPAIWELHNKFMEDFNVRDNPGILYSICYQDGIIHAFERISSKYKTGEYSCPHCLAVIIDNYYELRAQKLKMKKYDDVAYIDGYIDGLKFLLTVMDDENRFDLPFFYVFGYKEPIENVAAYRNVIKMAAEIHKTSFKLACKIVEELGTSLVYQHTAYLL